MKSTGSYEPIPFKDDTVPLIFVPYKRLSDYEYENLGMLRWHEQIEIKYFIRGGAEITYGPDVFTAQTGDLFIVNPFVCHKIILNSTADDPVYHLIMLNINHPIISSLYKDYPDLFSVKQNSIWPQPFPVRFKNHIYGEDLSCIKIIKLLADEYINPGINSGDYTACLLRAFMINLIREAAEPDAEPDFIYFQRQYAKKLHPAFDYINEHYTEEIRLGDLAASCNLSTGRFSHVFCLASGLSPFSYINQYKINKAAILLQNSQLDLIQIAHAAGFYEYAYFSRTFKKFKGISPIKFRQKNV